jgi:hypothetical protein
VAAIKEKLSATSAAQCVARGYELGLFRGGPPRTSTNVNDTSAGLPRER